MLFKFFSMLSAIAQLEPCLLVQNHHLSESKREGDRIIPLKLSANDLHSRRKLESLKKHMPPNYHEILGEQEESEAQYSGQRLLGHLPLSRNAYSSRVLL